MSTGRKIVIVTNSSHAHSPTWTCSATHIPIYATGIAAMPSAATVFEIMNLVVVVIVLQIVIVV